MPKSINWQFRKTHYLMLIVILINLLAYTYSASASPVFPVDASLGKWFAITYPGHDSGEIHQYSVIDLNLPDGSDNGVPVYAIESGRIWWKNASGGTLMIEHDVELQLINGYTYNSGWMSLYAHMKGITVNEGAYVKKGQVIGFVSNVDALGRQLEPHLHFGICEGYLKNSISPYWLDGYYREVDYFDYGGGITETSKRIYMPIPGGNWSESDLWYNLSVNATSEYNKVTDTARDAYFQGFVKYPLGTTLSGMGCFLSESKGTVESATPSNPGSALHVSDPAGAAYEEMTDGRATMAFYTAQGSPSTSSGFGKTLTPGSTYYYRFYSKRIVNGETLVSYSDIKSFTTDAVNVTVTMTAGAGGRISAGTTGTYASGSTISLTAVPDEGYSFAGWTSSNGGTFADASSQSTTFVVPDTDTTITANFVEDIRYGISVTPDVIDFGTLGEGYGTLPVKTFTVTNTGNQTITLSQNGHSNHFWFGSYSKTTLAPGETATGTVEPASNLGAGVYEDTVMISMGSIIACAPLTMKLAVVKADTWYNLSTNAASAYNKVTDTARDAYFQGFVKYPLSTTLSGIGCFLSETKSVVEAATPTSPGAALHVSDPSGFQYEEQSDGRATMAFYTAQGSPSNSSGFGKTLTPDTTYYYRFYSMRTVNGETLVSYSDVKNFTTDAENVTVTMNSSAGGRLSDGTTGIYASGSAISLTAVPDEGYSFAGWTSSNGGTFSDAHSAKTTFTVPNCNTTITAHFITTPVYSISIIPEDLDLGTLYCGYNRTLVMEASRVLTLKNTGNQTLTLDTTTKLPSFRFENYSKTELKPGEEATVTIIPEMNLEPRVHDFSLYVSASGNNGTVWAGAELDLKLTVKDNPALQKAVQCPHCLGTNTRIDNGIYDPYYELYEGKWTDNGDGTHTGMAVLVNWMYCEDCDNPLKRFSVPIAEPAMYTGKHVYLEGACNVCGKVVKECPHEMYTLRLVDEELIIYTPRYRDEQFHFQPRTETLYYECAECNELYSETWEAEFIYAHSYDANGLCDCGATGKPTTCEHSPMELREDEVNVRYKEIGELTHTRISDIYMNLWCPYCQTARQYNFWYAKRNTETHAYVAGKCVCGKNEPVELTNSYSLPIHTREIKAEAFLGTPVQQVIVNDGCQIIGSCAFAHCNALVRVVLPESIIEIAEDAFTGCNSLTIVGHDGSYAIEYAKRQRIPYSILD